MSNLPQIMREVRWALWLTLIYILGWIGFAYFSPSGRGYLGFPLWFEFACIYFPLLFVLCISIVIKKVYKDINLEGKEENVDE
ncbi:putative membrane protein YhdT [Nicoletella semolina]|uniref:Putative membrane protein YhdT n=1 Tax=Nicoletella semolina TaxID=271160 RepID=A0A4R2N7A9_9PAST|nr:DUF997 family protein [Nicoletella semolina]MDH2924409.1 hypothetical protein [Nicoletella semolina]TCP16811.1 putative membrane protein YhdT [Nicoletella semolina]